MLDLRGLLYTQRMTINYNKMSLGNKSFFFVLSQRSHTELVYIYVWFSAEGEDKSQHSSFEELPDKRQAW